MKTARNTLLMLLLITPAVWAEEGPRTGYFRITVTPTELLGPDGANAVSSVFAADEKLTWQLSVPESYDHSKPAGAMVFVGWAEWGGGKRSWNRVLEKRNAIWIGLVGASDKKPVNERMLKAILATSKPELFKGALYYAEALSWGKNTPAKIDLIRQNRYVFMAGALDDDKRDIIRVRESYTKAGVVNNDFVLVSNTNRKMPSPDYFERAWAFLDGDTAAAKGAE